MNKLENTIFDGVVGVSGSKVISMNDSARRIFGVEDIAGLHLRDISPEAEKLVAPVSEDGGRFHFWRNVVDPIAGVRRRDVFLSEIRWFFEKKEVDDNPFLRYDPFRVNEKEESEEGVAYLIVRDVTLVNSLEHQIGRLAYKDDISGVLSRLGFEELVVPRFNKELLTSFNFVDHDPANAFVDHANCQAILVIHMEGLVPFEKEPVLHASLLREIASRIRRAVRGDDLVGRISGSTFAVSISLIGPEEAYRAAKRIASVISLPCLIHGIDHMPFPRIGIAIQGADGQDLGALYAAAHEASQSDDESLAKKAYTIRYRDKELQTSIEESDAASSSLRRLLLRGAIHFEDEIFRNGDDELAAVRVSARGFSESAIWEEAKNLGMINSLLRQLADHASSLNQVNIALSFPSSQRKLMESLVMTTPARGKKNVYQLVDVTSSFNRHFLAGDHATVRMPIAFLANGSIPYSLSQMKKMKVDVILCYGLDDSESLIVSEINLAREHFFVFVEEKQHE